MVVLLWKSDECQVEWWCYYFRLQIFTTAFFLSSDSALSRIKNTRAKSSESIWFATFVIVSFHCELSAISFSAGGGGGWSILFPLNLSFSCLIHLNRFCLSNKTNDRFSLTIFKLVLPLIRIWRKRTPFFPPSTHEMQMSIAREKKDVTRLQRLDTFFERKKAHQYWNSRGRSRRRESTIWFGRLCCRSSPTSSSSTGKRAAKIMNRN